MNDILTKVKMDLTIKGYSPRTIKAYMRYIKEFSAHFGKSPLVAETSNIKQYLYYLTAHKKASYSYVKSAYSALKFMYHNSLKRKWDSIELPRAKAPKKLPIILSISEVQKILENSPNLKYKAIFTTIYSAGLRISEVQNLKIADIDSSNMQLYIRDAKGKKDRYTLLSKINLEILRSYWRVYRPKKWLFPGRNPIKPISARSIQSNLTETYKKAGIRKHVTPHTLRHCFATHLLEAGNDIYHIQHLLGHSRIDTTSLYIHLKRPAINVKSPMDSMSGDEND